MTVFGAGNVALDAARTALRLGAESSTIIYRRSRAEMPARHEEIEHAEEEGVKLFELVGPLHFNASESGVLKSVTLQRMALGEPDASGRRRPMPIEGEVFEHETDLAVVAVGTRSNPILLEATPGLELNKRGYIVVNEETGTLSEHISDSANESADFQIVLNQSIKKITEDIESLGFNTAISQSMILMNALEKEPAVTTGTIKTVVQLIAPFAPHIAEELWNRLGGTGTICDAAWPKADATKLQKNTQPIVFQVNGKLRGQLEMARSVSKDEMLAAARADENVKKFTDGKEIVREIVVPGKLVNIVVK